MFKHHYDKQKKPSFTKRIFRSSVSTVIIASFVLSVTYGVKYLSEKNPRMALYEYSRSVPRDSKVGQVAGALTEKYEEYIDKNQTVKENNDRSLSNNSTLDDGSSISDTTKSDATGTTVPMSDNVTDNERFVVALFADSHLDIKNLEKAVGLAKVMGTNVILHLGDHTNLGLLPDLRTAKAELDASGITYYAIPGDRDLWETAGPENFLQVFGSNKHTFTLGSFKFVVLDNSKNFSKIPQEDMEWFKHEVVDASFVVLSQPIYHPSNKVMGNFEGEKIISVREQAEELLKAIRQSDVKAVIAGDHHLSSEALDPEKPTLVHYVIGAITSEINDKPQAILQSSRISILELSSNGTFKIHEELL
jgi:predicted phosphodiesterase